MKKFDYSWTNEIFLLHIQLNNASGVPCTVVITREYTGGKPRTEVIDMKNGVKSHRFIVSRTHPKEEKVTIDYPESIVLEAFKLDDRAYYPTESFYAI